MKKIYLVYFLQKEKSEVADYWSFTNPIPIERKSHIKLLFSHYRGNATQCWVTDPYEETNSIYYRTKAIWRRLNKRGQLKKLYA